MLQFLDKKHTVARPDFNRWMVPPAALAIHLSIGMAYGFSVFWKPLEKAIGVTEPAAGDWKRPSLVIVYTLFFVLLGSSAAIFGSWLERNGPRKAGVVASFCWGGGFLISALGVYYHQIVLLWLGSGVIGGCGLGLGYISPVSTLVKWFPDKRGMATGMAIMGFGGGALLGMPLADALMKHYETPTSVGVWQTFVTMGCIYFVAMMCGAFSYRIPPPGWKPHGWTEPIDSRSHLVTQGHVHVRNAHNAPQFWLLWVVLCLNVTASIGIIAVASPMFQEVFGGKLIGLSKPISALPASQAEAAIASLATVGAGFGGLLSLFNIGGRIFWASLSDHLGRKRTYFTFFVLGIALYSAAAFAATTGSVALFVGLFCVILSMYGGGFATIPAYLADLFGTKYVGAIHGRLLTAWSVAGILGPVLVTRIYQYQIDHGTPPASAYNVIFYTVAGLLFIGFISNLLVRPVDKRHFMSEDELEEEWQMKPVTARSSKDPTVESTKPSGGSWVKVGIGWTLVGIPLAWGILKSIETAAKLFH